MDESLPSYTPQAIHDLLPIYCPQNSDDHVLTYTLRQLSPSLQTLTPTPSRASNQSTYDIKTRSTGGFMNKKPHVVISDSAKDIKIAEGRFDIHGTGSTVGYAGNIEQQLELQNSQAQLLRTTIRGRVHWWQPHPGNKSVLELTNEYDEVVARFVHKEDQEGMLRRGSSSPQAPGPQRRSSVIAPTKTAKKDKKDQEYDIGNLQIVDELVTGEGEGKAAAREEVIGSAIVVIERAKRRKANMAKSGPGLKGPANWGWDGAPAGHYA